MLFDDDKAKDLDLEDENKKDEDDDSKYYVEEEGIKTVFQEPKPQEKVIIEEEEEIIPQDAEDYEVASQLIEEETDRLAPITISTEMRKSFLEYAMSVIVARALPDARDGLKPVHRRILYGMHELGLTASVAHKKSARIVGDVLGKYHPHGDSSVYEAMVRLSQDFSMRYPMVDGHGNFGSIDGDGAAAMRYTEARMSKIAAAMVDGIKKDTVNFIDNYDGSETEPSVLPARIPNLLISGATGIAVGMATSIPPHNLTEVINGVVALARNSEITTEDLMERVSGPDFPTGGIIAGSAGIVKSYTTGRGSVKLRAKTHIEELKNGKTRIVVTEIPYMVNKANMIEKIAHLVKDKAIDGITDLRDETSRKDAEGYILSIGEDGFGKMTHVTEYRQTKRGAKGVKSINTKKAGYLKFVEVVKGSEDILIVTKQGITIRTSLTQVATSSRGTKGVKVIKLQEGNAIKSIAVIDVADVEEKVEEAIRKTQEISLKQLKEAEEK
ncbi:DNA gyrase subunit A [Elysia marginata]|uniref:DNA gyrase subunit A n=1 Tax=Elysia marginata TaxID=1093978 RepID=A0AAV4FQZ0_9GAST|nr:DNA gyrase subunit A [Elysia marginata]